jgi:hypothetical protein
MQPTGASFVSTKKDAPFLPHMAKAAVEVPVEVLEVGSESDPPPDGADLSLLDGVSGVTGVLGDVEGGSEGELGEVVGGIVGDVSDGALGGVVGDVSGGVVGELGGVVEGVSGAVPGVLGSVVGGVPCDRRTGPFFCA